VRERVEVPVRTLDAFLAADAGWTEPIELLKIATQGTELPVLTGAVGSLERVRLIWTEVSFRPMYRGSAVFADIHEFLDRQALASTRSTMGSGGVMASYRRPTPFSLDRPPRRNS